MRNGASAIAARGRVAWRTPLRVRIPSLRDWLAAQRSRSRPAALAAIRSGDCETPRPCGLAGRQGVVAIEAGRLKALHPLLPAIRYGRERPGELIHLDRRGQSSRNPVSVGCMKAAVAESVEGLFAGNAVVVHTSVTLADGSLIERRLEANRQPWSSTGRADVSCAELRCNPRGLHASWQCGRRDCGARLSS